MARRNEILQAIGEDLGRPGTRPFAPETNLIVVICPGLSVDVVDEADWMRWRKCRPKQQGKKLTPREMDEQVRRMIIEGSRTGASCFRVPLGSGP